MGKEKRVLSGIEMLSKLSPGKLPRSVCSIHRTLHPRKSPCQTPPTKFQGTERRFSDENHSYPVISKTAIFDLASISSPENPQPGTKWKLASSGEFLPFSPFFQWVEAEVVFQYSVMLKRITDDAHTGSCLSVLESSFPCSKMFPSYPWLPWGRLSSSGAWKSQSDSRDAIRMCQPHCCDRQRRTLPWLRSKECWQDFWAGIKLAFPSQFEPSSKACPWGIRHWRPYLLPPRANEFLLPAQPPK